MASQKAAAAAAARVRFTIQDDINILREVYATNPFEDPRRWDQIADLVSQGTGKSFSKRAILDRVDLLLAQFERNDKANLSKSGTEEEYDEKCHLLQDVLDMAKEFGYIVKKGITNKISACRPLPRSGPTSEKACASATRDGAAAAHTPDQVYCSPPEMQSSWLQGASQSAAEVQHEMCSADEGGDNFEDQQNNADSVRGIQSFSSWLDSQDASNGQVISSREVDCSMPPPLNSTQSATTAALTQQSMASTPTRDPARQGKRGPSKRKEPEENIDFFQRRLDHDIIWRQKQHETEKEKLRLEDKRIALEKEKLEQHRQEWLAERTERDKERRLRIELLAGLQQQLHRQSQERAEERCIFVAQQNASLELIKTLIQQQKK